MGSCLIAVALIGCLVQQDDNRHEGEDGEQDADQDDEAIRSLHEVFPFVIG